MTIIGWVLFLLFVAVICLAVVTAIIRFTDRPWVVAICLIMAVILCIGGYFVGRWYFTCTASGIRAMNDQKSEFDNVLNRVITIYTSNGEKIAEYKGKIDLEMGNDYLKFDWQGKRYIYYNCFIETIADIP